MYLEDDWLERGLIEFIERTPEKVEVLFHVTEEHLTPFQALHGGINGALIETIASIGATLRAEKGYHAVGVSLSVNHVKKASLGETLRAVTTPTHSGRRMQFWSATITNQSGQVTAYGDLSLMNVESDVRPIGREYTEYEA